MKKYHTLFFFLLQYSFAQAQSFTLTGKITGNNQGAIHLYFTDSAGHRTNDSTQVSGDAFVFTGTIGGPTQGYLFLDKDNQTSIFLEPAVMSVALKAGDFSNAVVTGSKSQVEEAELNKLEQPILEEMKPMDSAYGKAGEIYRKAAKDKEPEAVLDSMREQLARMHDAFGPFQSRIAAITYDFFNSHPQSYVTAAHLRFYTGTLPLDSLQMFYDRLGQVIQQSTSGKEIAKEIRQIRSGSPGSMAADFTATDLLGKPLQLSSFRGQYVLLDFWASWCVPCRHGNPHLIEIYRKYHDAGLDIIGVSDDDNNHAAWKKAVEKDSVGLWHHVLRGLDWDKLRNEGESPNDISIKFGIHELPTKILIGKDGKIIGRYDEEPGPLDAKLSELFGK